MKNKSIKELIQQLAKDNAEPYSIIGKVISYDSDTQTCEVEPINGAANVLQARLLTGHTSNKTGILIIPKINSNVIINFISKDLAYIAMFEDIENIYFNGDQFGGLIKIDELVTRLNTVEDKLTSLITKFNAHVHTGVITGAGSTGTTTTPETSDHGTTLKNDIENPIIKHG